MRSRWLLPVLFASAGHAAPRQSNPAFLGIQMINGPDGCVIEGVTAGSPAADARAEIGDTILAFDKIPLAQPQPCDQLVANITTHSPNDRIRVDIERNTVHRTLSVTLSTRADVLQKRVGQRVGTTDLIDVDDNRHHYDLSDSGRTTVVGWFTDRCSGCARVFDRIADGLKDRAKTDVFVLAVMPRSEREDIDLRKSFNSPVALAVADNDTFTALSMDEQDRAFFMVIDCKGITRLVTPIAPDSDDLDGAVDEVLAGAEQAEHTRTTRR
ncbi:MAG: PDZ domain-containing protein [Kofleriaceae bacterium]